MGADYIYAAAEIRGKEHKLLRKEQLSAMTETGNMDDVCKVLQDADYGKEDVVITPKNYEQILKEEEQKVFDLIIELSKEDRVFDIFRLPYDYHNIKVLLKSEFLQIDRTALLSPNGTFEINEMIRCVNERDHMTLTEKMSQAIEEAVDSHARTKDPQKIDIICDRYCFEEMLEVAESEKNKFALGYLKLWIDTINLKTFARIRKMNQPWSVLETVFISGGNVELPIFVEIFDADSKNIEEKLAPTDIASAVIEGADAFAPDGSFTKLEKACDNLLIEYVQDAKTITFGPEPLMAYLIAKQMEIKCVRIIMTGRLGNMDPKVIMERMRETYE